MFPDTSQALQDPNGLLAVGGELTSERLVEAYRRGIFPWYEEPQPVLWWTPDPRLVLFPDELHISRSLRKTLRRDSFALSVDTVFSEVMQLCADVRADGPGTWIGKDMLSAYGDLHRRGVAHSIEVWSDGELVGGLYGLHIGKAFFGESMFSTITDASKVALVGLVNIARQDGWRVIDCQVDNDHLQSLGARCISRLDFEALLAQTVDLETRREQWQLPLSCGGLH